MWTVRNERRCTVSGYVKIKWFRSPCVRQSKQMEKILRNKSMKISTECVGKGSWDRQQRRTQSTNESEIRVDAKSLFLLLVFWLLLVCRQMGMRYRGVGTKSISSFLSYKFPWNIYTPNSLHTYKSRATPFTSSHRYMRFSVRIYFSFFSQPYDLWWSCTALLCCLIYVFRSKLYIFVYRK